MNFHSSPSPDPVQLLMQFSRSEWMVTEPRLELAVGLREPSLEVTGLEECSSLALADAQHRETCLKYIIKDSLGSLAIP